MTNKKTVIQKVQGILNASSMIKDRVTEFFTAFDALVKENRLSVDNIDQDFNAVFTEHADGLFWFTYQVKKHTNDSSKYTHFLETAVALGMFSKEALVVQVLTKIVRDHDQPGCEYAVLVDLLNHITFNTSSLNFTQPQKEALKKLALDNFASWFESDSYAKTDDGKSALSRVLFIMGKTQKNYGEASRRNLDRSTSFSNMPKVRVVATRLGAKSTSQMRPPVTNGAGLASRATASLSSMPAPGRVGSEITDIDLIVSNLKQVIGVIKKYPNDTETVSEFMEKFKAYYNKVKKFAAANMEEFKKGNSFVCLTADNVQSVTQTIKNNIDDDAYETFLEQAEEVGFCYRAPVPAPPPAAAPASAAQVRNSAQKVIVYEGIDQLIKSINEQAQQYHDDKGNKFSANRIGKNKALTQIKQTIALMFALEAHKKLINPLLKLKEGDSFPQATFELIKNNEHHYGELSQGLNGTDQWSGELKITNAHLTAARKDAKYILMGLFGNAAGETNNKLIALIDARQNPHWDYFFSPVRRFMGNATTGTRKIIEEIVSELISWDGMAIRKAIVRDSRVADGGLRNVMPAEGNVIYLQNAM